MSRSEKQKAWSLDQITKSAFFHQKLHQWQLLEIAQAIETVQGELLDWQLDNLNISQNAWDKVIHRGIKPVVVFAHPQVLITISRSVSYYRMLAMVSQKSMNQIGLPVTSYETGKTALLEAKSFLIARRLNQLISNLIETDEQINAREFDLWRGMAAGSQAQGSWQNTKGDEAEIVIKNMLRLRVEELNQVAEGDLTEEGRFLRIALKDGRNVVFGDEPDIAIYKHGLIVVAIEIKGGIDTAGVLERVGAAMNYSVASYGVSLANSQSRSKLRGIRP